MCGMRMRMPVFAFLVTESDADVVHPAWNNRFVHVVGLYGDDVSVGVAGGQHRDAVFAIVLPWIRLYHSQHRVFLFVARRDGFQPLLPRAGCVQHAAHVGGRMPGVCRLCEDDRLVCGRRFFALYERCVVAPQLIRHWLAVDNRRDAHCRSEGGLWLGLLWMCVPDSRIPALRFADTQAQIVYAAMESGGQNGEEILQSCTALNVRFQFLA